MDTAAVADLTAAQKLIEAELTRRRETSKALKTRPYIGVSDNPQQPSAGSITFWRWSRHNHRQSQLQVFQRADFFQAELRPEKEP